MPDGHLTRKEKVPAMAEKYAYRVVARERAWWHVLPMDNLAAIRKSRGLTQTQLAQMIAANQATISKIESGEGNPTLDMITRIAHALSVHPSQLFSKDALERRAMAAINSLPDDAAKEAAILVLEMMAKGAKPEG